MSERRLVVKIGSSTLTDASGRIDDKQIKALAAQIASVHSSGWQVSVVSSGAIACGLEALRISERPNAIVDLQAAASIGQGLLVHRWNEAFSGHDIIAGQVLLTQSDFAHRESYLNARRALGRLLELRAVPIINENDATAVQEIRMGDNDTLAAMVADAVQARALVLLSDVEGLCDADGACLSVVEDITPEVEDFAGGPAGPFGSGGMATKVGAAKVVTNNGIAMVIADGRAPDIIKRITDGLAGRSVPGTLFLPRSRRVTGRKAWIAFGRLPKGAVTVDKGAEEAIRNRGRSLLAAGIAQVHGAFIVGDTVNVMGEDGRIVARGLSNYSAEEVEKIMGLKSSEAIDRFGEDFSEEVIHRDSLVVIE